MKYRGSIEPSICAAAPILKFSLILRAQHYREQKRHMKLFHIQLLSVTRLLILPTGNTSKKKKLIFLAFRGQYIKLCPPKYPAGSPEGSPAKKIYAYVLFSLLTLRRHLPKRHLTLSGIGHHKGSIELQRTAQTRFYRTLRIKPRLFSLPF